MRLVIRFRERNGKLFVNGELFFFKFLKFVFIDLLLLFYLFIFLLLLLLKRMLHKLLQWLNLRPNLKNVVLALLEI